MDKVAQALRFPVQSSCLAALLDSELGQVLFMKSCGSEFVPVREQKMLSLIASSATFVKETSNAEVSLQGAAGSAIHIVWREISSRITLIILGSVEHFQNPEAMDDFGTVVSTTCFFLFGNVLHKQDACPIRLQHDSLSLFGDFIDTFFAKSVNISEGGLPLTFFTPIIEADSRIGSSETLNGCMDSFCEAVDSVGGIMLHQNRIFLIRNLLLEVLDNVSLRCIIILCIAAARIMAVKGQFLKCLSLNIALIDRRTKSLLPCKLVLTEVLVDQHRLLTMFIFDCSTGNDLLAENLSNEINRYWSPIISSQIENEPLALTDVTSKVFRRFETAGEGNHSKPSFHNLVLPLSICVSHYKTNIGIWYPDDSDSHEKLIALTVKAQKYFLAPSQSKLQRSRCPNALCLRYKDFLSIAILRPPLNIYAILPSNCSNNEAFNFVAEVGLELLLNNASIFMV